MILWKNDESDRKGNGIINSNKELLDVTYASGTLLGAANTERNHYDKTLAPVKLLYSSWGETN